MPQKRYYDPAKNPQPSGKGARYAKVMTAKEILAEIAKANTRQQKRALQREYDKMTRKEKGK